MKIEDIVSYRDLLDNLADGVYFTDAHRQILFWNRGAEQITGFPREEVTGHHCWDDQLMHIDSEGHGLCKTGYCPLVRAINSGTMQITEAYLRHRQGHRVPVLIKTMPMRDNDGKIVGAVEVFNDNSAALAMKRTVRELERLALLDPLTGLSNRRHMETALRAGMEEHGRHGTGMGVCFLDVDNFKAVNDTHGHDAGDEALRVVARNLAGNSRAYDVAGRWGGEEFLIASSRLDLAELCVIAERYRTLIENSRVTWAGDKFSVTVSIGATMVREDDTVESVVTRADQLMYESKRAGKNRVTCR